ncbi:MAG: ATP-grasp domain-containing protein [Candidatus Solibacter usitatus]|nr:ATP-grasp domain-containing protein [Candidatus Solibacter usitatus]
MARLLLFAATTGYQTRIFADAAKRLGLDVTLATDRCHVLEDPWGDHAIPVRFEDPNACRDAVAGLGPFDAIVAVSDRPTLAAALTAEALGIPYNSPASVAAARDKYLARQLYQAAGLPVPRFYRFSLEDDPQAAARGAFYPCVLKPLGLSASRGVIRANDAAEFVAAFQRIKAMLESVEVAILREEQHRYVQVESYIEGREFALEGLLTDGRLQVLAIFDKPDPLEGPYFEETIYVTPSRAGREVENALIAAVHRAVTALGLTRGPVHAELRYDGQAAWILEVAARPIGGLCALSLRFDGGMPLEELLLRHALGENVANVKLADGASGVMMIPIPKGGIYQGVAGVDEARAVAGIEDVIITAKEGQEILPLPEGATYLGFIFARGDGAGEVERVLREAHARLRFEIATTLPVRV